MLEARCATQISLIQAQNLYRTRLLTSHRQGNLIFHENKSLISFNNNDYLGLAQHPESKETLKQAIEKDGIGSGGSHLLGGHYASHQALEEELADFVGQPAALLFSTGYMANLSTLLSLADRSDKLFQDRLNHASLMDACLYTRCPFSRYQHKDMNDLSQKLARHHQTSLSWLITDGVFSVDGDIAPLKELVQLAKSHQSVLMVDDAHGIGVLGDEGRGSIDSEGLSPSDVTLITGSCGIALGTFGAFVAGSKTLIETLIQSARGYIYTTALPPAIAETTRANLKLLRQANAERFLLKELISYFQRCARQLNLPLLPSSTPIQPIQIGDNYTALHITQRLKQKGFLVGVIRPPTVPKNNARLRISLNIHHTQHQIDQLLDIVSQAISILPEKINVIA